MTNQLKTVIKEEYSMAIERFKTRAKRCIDCKESYFEQKIFKIFSLCVVLYDFCLKTYGPHYV